MKYKKLYNIARTIKKKNLHKNTVLKLLDKFKPKYIGRGAFKRCFKVKSNKRNLVFKIGNIKDDFIHYQKAKNKRKTKYAKIYWVTNYCLLQKLCITNKLYSKEEFLNLKNAWKQNGYVDIRPANVGKINNKLYAFDIIKSKRNI